MMQPIQEQVDPAIQEISQFFANSMEQGGKPEEIVMSLMQQEVDQNTIAQALMMVGYQEDDITVLFDSVQKMSQPKPASINQVNSNPQELARNEEIASQQKGPVAVDPIEMAKSGIEIKPENRGKFTRWAKKRGMTVPEAAEMVMANKDAYPPSVVKMANFAKNAAGFKKEEGGGIDYTEGVRQREGSYNPPNRKYTLDPRFKQEGGEFEPHLMYDTKTGKAYKANELADHKKYAKLGYVHKDELKKAKGGSVSWNWKGKSYSGTLIPSMENENNRYARTENGKIKTLPKGQEGIEKKNEGILSNQTYFNPNAFKTGNNFSFGKAANVLSEGLNNMFSREDNDGDGVKDGSFKDWAGKAKRNKAEKLANTTYEIGPIDMSQENTDAILAFKNQYDIENPEKDALGNIISDNLEINEQPLDAFSTWLNQNASNLSGKALETFNALKNKISSKKYGSELPKAQYGFDPYNDDLGEFMQNAGQTNYMEDMMSMTPIGTREMDVDINTEPVQRSAADLFGDINMPEITANTGGLEGFLDRSKNSVVATAFGDLSDFAVKGADVLNDFFEDKNIMDAKDEMRGRLVADNIYGTKTDAFNKRGTFDVNSGLMGSEADRTTGLYFSKGGGTDNEGFRKLPIAVQNQILAGMRTGGEESYLANRDRVIKAAIAEQDKAKEGGEAAYLANRDRVIKQAIANQDKAQDGGEESMMSKMMSKYFKSTDSDENIFDNLNSEQKNTEIYTMLEPYLPNLNSSNAQEIYDLIRSDEQTEGEMLKTLMSLPLKKYIKDMDLSNKEFMDLIKKTDMYNDNKALVNSGLAYKGVVGPVSGFLNSIFKDGGEEQKSDQTINVNSAMLAKLIAAGADIEIL